MEAAQEGNTNLISYTPASLGAKGSNPLSIPQPLNASVAAFLDYLEAFYETLDSAIEAIERVEQLDQRSWPDYSAYNPKPTIRTEYEGQYQCECENFFYAMHQIITLLYITMRKGVKSKHEAKFLTEQECYSLFNCVAVHAGFLNTLIVSFVNRTFYFSYHRKIDFTALDSFTRLIDFTRPLREQEWDTLRSEAMKRFKTLEEYNHDSRGGFSGIYGFRDVLRYYCGSLYHFDSPRIVATVELDKVVTEIITEEVIRFRRFLEAFHGTLHFLADAKPLAQTKIKPPMFDWDKKKEALSIFKHTIELLRTIATGGTVSIPQTQIVESSLVQNPPVAPSQTEELFTVEIEDIGTVIALSKSDAALVVFAPAKYKRKIVTVTTARGLEIVAYLAQQYAIDEDFYVAIFPRLPLQDGITETVEVACDKLRGKATLVACNTIRVFLGEE